MNKININIIDSLIDSNYSLDNDVQSFIIEEKKKSIYENVLNVINKVSLIVGIETIGYKLYKNNIDVYNKECKALYKLKFKSNDNRFINIEIEEKGDQYFSSLNYKNKYASFILKNNNIDQFYLNKYDELKDYIKIADELCELDKYL